MKKTFAVAALALTVSTAGIGFANAQNLGVDVVANTKVNTEVNVNNVKVKASSSVDVRGNATSSQAKSDHATSTRGNATSTEARNDNASEPKEDAKDNDSGNHRSVVASFVQSLHAIADRDGGIGSEVRAVAQVQNDSLETTVDAMTKVEARGSVRTFLFGSDYKNLGVIRSEIAKTEANINHLSELSEQTTDSEVRAELTAEIKTLEAEQVKMNAYLKAHESTFSLFGWFNRMFV